MKKTFTFIVALCAILMVGMASVNTHTGGVLPDSLMASLVGGNVNAGCMGAAVGLGLGFLAAAAVTAATGGAGAVAFAVLGSYAPIVGAGLCSL